MPVATLDPPVDTVAAPPRPVLVVCLSDDDDIDALRAAVATPAGQRRPGAADGVRREGGVMDAHDAARREDRAPICGWCGVTALPGAAVGVAAAFVCDNADCPAAGEPVD